MIFYCPSALFLRLAGRSQVSLKKKCGGRQSEREMERGSRQLLRTRYMPVYRYMMYTHIIEGRMKTDAHRYIPVWPRRSSRGMELQVLHVAGSISRVVLFTFKFPSSFPFFARERATDQDYSRIYLHTVSCMHIVSFIAIHELEIYNIYTHTYI